MISVIVCAVIVIVLCFGAVVAFGPPYLPTLARQVQAALDLLDLKPGQTLLELGSGDGRVLLAGAKRGLQVVGYELNPLLVLASRAYTWRYRKQVRVVWGSYWRQWPSADGIFTFMLPRYMARLDQTIAAWHRQPVRLATFAFTIPGKKLSAKQHGVFLYKYN